MSTLTQLVDHVAADLKDTGNTSWSAEELARALRWALHELCWAAPRRGTATIAAQDDVREYSLAAAGVTGLLFITEVGYPYDSGEPAYPPRSVPWRLLDDDTLFLDVASVVGGEMIRLFCARPHTLEGLDGAAATTLSAEQEELLCLGAAGYAALQRAQDAIGRVNVSLQAPQLWREWGESRLHAFRARLVQIARREGQWHTAWTQGWEL